MSAISERLKDHYKHVFDVTVCGICEWPLSDPSGTLTCVGHRHPRGGHVIMLKPVPDTTLRERPREIERKYGKAGR